MDLRFEGCGVWVRGSQFEVGVQGIRFSDQGLGFRVEV